MKRSLSLILAIMMLITSSLIFTSCKDKEKHEGLETVAFKYTLTIKDADGNEETLELESNKTFLTDALIEEGIIDGEKLDGGFNLKSVKGIEADTMETGLKWYLYVNGELSDLPLDSVALVEGNIYILALEDIIDVPFEAPSDSVESEEVSDTADSAEDSDTSEITEELTV